MGLTPGLESRDGAAEASSPQPRSPQSPSSPWLPLLSSPPLMSNGLSAHSQSARYSNKPPGAVDTGRGKRVWREGSTARTECVVRNPHATFSWQWQRFRGLAGAARSRWPQGCMPAADKEMGPLQPWHFQLLQSQFAIDAPTASSKEAHSSPYSQRVILQICKMTLVLYCTATTQAQAALEHKRTSQLSQMRSTPLKNAVCHDRKTESRRQGKIPHQHQHHQQAKPVSHWRLTD